MSGSRHQLSSGGQLPAALSPADGLHWFVGLENTCVYPRQSDGFAPLDEHELTGHNQHWQGDINRVAGLGVAGLRYGMSWPAVHTAPGRFDWRRLDPVLDEIQSRDLHVIADLVHYGCPPWLEGSFVDPAFVPALTEFAVALVERYGPMIGSLTPVNEPSTTASFCGLRTVWPPALGSKQGWAAVAVALAEAAQSVVRHIREEAPHIPIVHVEASHLYEATDSSLDGQVAELIMLGDLPTDLVVGACPPDAPGARWLVDHGIHPERLSRLVEEAEPPDVLGINYYPGLTPRLLVQSGSAVQQLTVNRWTTGLARVVRHAAGRYGLPLMVTETSIEGSEQRRARWLRDAVVELDELRRDGVDIRGLTWWPLIDFVDWSYIADGASVEEFVAGVFDPGRRELVAESIPRRNRNAGIPAFARRMGLFTLEDDGLRRTATAAVEEFVQLATASGSSTEAAGHWSAGAPSVHADTVVLDRGWTFTDPMGFEAPIAVPGLWEAQGHVELDGVVRYRTRFNVHDPSGHWTLRFGAVMDHARVKLNGIQVGLHHLPYTPFEIDVSGLIGTANELVVDVTDPPAGSPAHLAGAHGKQGWANHEFPSPPSLYLTYGGIWQPVTLRRHGEVAIRDLRCNLDPFDTVVTVELHRLPDSQPDDARVDDGTATADRRADTDVTVMVELGGVARSVSTAIGYGERSEVVVPFGDTGLARWSPEQPILHRCRAAVTVAAERAKASETDSAEIQVGLRTVEITDGRLCVNNRPVLMRSALVQGFHHEHLYSEGTDEEIENEIRSAQEHGFNMLRLHLRPFDPRYLAACDRLGMLVHCDIPIAEPIDHDQLDDLGPAARHCADAIAAQVRRDRSHPAIVLWSCMNEIGIDRPSLRYTDRYERFVRRMVETLLAADDTRPFIENDWIHPDTERVFTAPLATAHWYGQLERSYLDTLSARCHGLRREPLPVAVTEFGDWGLPDPRVGAGRFYEHAPAYEKMLGDTFWPGSLAEFSSATQGYQGIANRLQIDIIRVSGASAGYCLTELTDVPWEFNGVLDIERNPKPDAAAHLMAANREISPILVFSEFGAAAGQQMAADAWIVNDSDADLSLAVRIVQGDAVASLGRHVVSANSVADIGPVQITASSTPGVTEVVLEARDLAGGCFYQSSYPVVVHGTPPVVPITVQTADPAAARMVAATPWLREGPTRLMLVGEDQMGEVGDDLSRHLSTGAVAVVMAQHSSCGPVYPGADALLEIRSEWGGTPFRYTTDTPVVRAFPPQAVLHVHDSDVAPDAVVVPAAPVVAAAVGVFKPLPRQAAGLVVGALAVGGGTLVVCQYRLQTASASASATAQAVFADVVSWAHTLSQPANPVDPDSGAART